MSAISAELARLSITDRVPLVEDPWDSIAAEAPEAIALIDSQRDELRRRWQAHRDDPAAAVPWDEVRREIRAQGSR